MGKDDNTAGWILTTLVYALGGRMETGSGTKREGDAQQPADRRRRSSMLQQMRWTDNSMGSNFDYGWSDINQAFAAGQVGMYVSGSDVFTNLVQASNIDPSIYGVTTIPLAAGNRRPASSAAARWPPCGRTRTPTSSAAAVKWIDFFYEQPLDQQGAGDPQREDAGRLEAAGRRAGPADLQPGAVRPRQHLDQAVHQRAAGADDSRSRTASSSRR